MGTLGHTGKSLLFDTYRTSVGECFRHSGVIVPTKMYAVRNRLLLLGLVRILQQQGCSSYRHPRPQWRAFSDIVWRGMALEIILGDWRLVWSRRSVPLPSNVLQIGYTAHNYIQRTNKKKKPSNRIFRIIVDVELMNQENHFATKIWEWY